MTYQPWLKVWNREKAKLVSKPINTEDAPVMKPSSKLAGLYEMKSFPHGVALILNNKTFDQTEDHKFKDRDGTEIDVKNLVETFRFLGYRVKVRHQCTKMEIEKSFDDINTLVEKGDDSFVCCILSHGDDIVIYGCDSNPVFLRGGRDECLEQKLARCKSLHCKPKLFFISACRGNKSAKSVADSSNPHKTSIRSEFGFYCSTLFEEVSMRNPDWGTYFVSNLCQVLCQYATNATLSEMIKKVNQSVGEVGYDCQVTDSGEQLEHNVYFFNDKF